MQGLRYIATI